MPSIRHVILGTDFSPGAQQALDLAMALAAAVGVPVTVVHVCQPALDEGDERRLLVSGQALRATVARQRRSGITVAGVLRLGEPWKKLDNMAAEVGAGLIVVGRAGAGGGPNGGLGSVAEALVRKASRPVLTTPCDFDRLAAEAHAVDSTTKEQP